MYENGESLLFCDQLQKVHWVINGTTAVVAAAKDAPMGRFGSVQPNHSDNDRVRLVLAKNFRTSNGSVAIFIIFPMIFVTTYK